MEEQGRFVELRTAYDAAFEQLSEEVRTLKVAQRRVEEAERTYRMRRDELADFVLAQHGQEMEEAAQV